MVDKLKFANSLQERIILVMNRRINYSAKIAKEANATYSGVNKMIKILLELKLICEFDKYKDGRVIYLKLTAKGKKIQEILRKLKNETRW